MNSIVDGLKARLKVAREAVSRAEEHVEDTIERSPERLAQQSLEQRQAELQQVELDIKLAELAELEAEIVQALQLKAALHRRIQAKLADLVPDLQHLDAVEQQGSQLSSKAFNLALEIPGTPLTSSWRDPKLAGVGGIVRQWLQRLEG